MPGKRINPNLIKTHFSYTASELAKRLGVHKNTIRNWVRGGLPVLPGRAELSVQSSPQTMPAAEGPALPEPSTVSVAATIASRRSAWLISPIDRAAQAI